MENKFNTIIKQLKEIKMTPDEKSVTLHNLVAYMETHPIEAKVPATATPRTFLKPTPSPFFSRFSFSPALRVVTLVLIVAVITGSGASFAAASALPGDVLYPVKVNFNEAIASALKTTPEAKADYAESLVETRLAEAQTLIDEGKFSGTRQAEAEAQIDTHMQLALARIDTLPIEKRADHERKADEVLFPGIARHRAFVAALAKRAPAEASTTVEIKTPETGTALITPTTDTPTSATNTGTTTTVSSPAPAPFSADGADTTSELILMADHQITLANGALNNLRAIHPVRDDIRTKLEQRISAIASVISDAQAEFRLAHYRDAIALANKAIVMAQDTRDAINKLIAESDTTTGTPTPSPSPTTSIE